MLWDALGCFGMLWDALGGSGGFKDDESRRMCYRRASGKRRKRVVEGGGGGRRGVVPLPALPDENDVTGIFISQIRMEMKCFTQTLPVGGEWAGPVGGTWK